MEELLKAPSVQFVTAVHHFAAFNTYTKSVDDRNMINYMNNHQLHVKNADREFH